MLDRPAIGLSGQSTGSEPSRSDPGAPGQLPGTPKFYLAALAAQASAAPAAEVDERGRTPAVVIDESHLLDHHELDAIRMLTNYDTDSATPFAVLLIGQPTLRKQMKHGVLAALDQRISISYQIPTMTKEETAGYIKHHFTIAGRRVPEPFLVNIRSTQDRQLPPKPLINRCYFT
ncbi:AAA family ATPase [Streptomyces sp. NPDC059385]|uniref:AAA family ATPase n=1 Tax=Streptomyces sp. NPDC059385 TaxID=3346817 RepID=UPI003680A7FD